MSARLDGVSDNPLAPSCPKTMPSCCPDRFHHQRPLRHGTPGVPCSPISGAQRIQKHNSFLKLKTSWSVLMHSSPRHKTPADVFASCGAHATMPMRFRARQIPCLFVGGKPTKARIGLRISCRLLTCHPGRPKAQGTRKSGRSWNNSSICCSFM